MLRTLDAFTTFDQIYVLTQGGPGRRPSSVAYYGYDSFFRFQRYGFAAAMLIMCSLVLLAFSARGGAGAAEDRDAMRRFLHYLALAIACLIALTPIFWMISTSFKTNREATQDGTSCRPPRRSRATPACSRGASSATTSRTR